MFYSRINNYISVGMGLLVSLSLVACGPGTGRDSTIGRQAQSVLDESRPEGKRYRLGPQYEAQLQAMVIKEAEHLGVGREGVPIEINHEVLVNINYFLNEGRGFMTRSLNRGAKYIPMMKAIFRQKGLPEDLVYLALIESGFRTEAVSTASAVGPWQFISGTGRRYGLAINEWVDERMDPVKSTYAAADYLTDLHDMFGSWPLAVAAYNSGEGKILKGMKNFGADNFWDMSAVGGHLAGETKRYVPAYLAATIIAKDPSAYGLNLDPEKPEAWEEVVVQRPMDLEAAAQMADTSAARLKELNPHLKKWSTPLDETDFVLRVPAGAQKDFNTAYAKDDYGRKTQLASHQVKRGDTLNSVAAQYGLEPQALKRYNSLKSNSLQVGSRLRLPTGQVADASAVMSDAPQRTDLSAEVVAYQIKPGDTKTGIAYLFDQSWGDIASLNGFDRNYQLVAGQSIKVRQPKGKSPVKRVEVGETRQVAAKVNSGGGKEPRLASIRHKVQKGETLGAISKRYGVSVNDLKNANNLSSNSVVVGQIILINSNLPLTAKAAGGKSKLLVVEETVAPAKASAVHEVKSGDTLGAIAQKYGMSSDEIRKLNNISGNNIRVGQKLKVTAAKSSGAAKAAGSHEVKSGETLGGIAQKYGLSAGELRTLNNISGNNIRVGQKLKVAAAAPAAPAAGKGQTAAQQAKAAVSHEVKSGETLGGIAQKYGLSADEIRKLNNISGNNIRVGQKLKVAAAAPAAPAAGKGQTAAPSAKAQAAAPKTPGHTVADGETLYSIARKYGLSADELKDLNGLESANIRPGQQLKVAGKAPAKGSGSSAANSQKTAAQKAPAAKSPKTYTVADGDTLYSIARKHNTSVEAIKKLNNLAGDVVQPKQTIKVN